MKLKCTKSIGGTFRKGEMYELEEYPVEDYHFTAIKDDKGALNMISVEDEEDIEWVNKHFVEIG